MTASSRPPGRLPNYLVIGAAKAGTTSLATYLSHHPQAFVAAQKEVNFFDDYWNLGVNWYRRQFEGARDAAAVGEASVSYLFRPEAPPRMAEVVPDAKLVALLRDPVDRAYSHYWFARGWGSEKRPFSEAIAGDEHDDDPGRAYLARGRYVHQLRRVCEFFPREQLLVLLFDDLRDDPGATFGKVCRFIGVDERAAPSNVGETYNVMPTFRLEIVQRVLHRLDRWRTLPQWFVRPIVRLNATTRRYPPLDPVVRAALVERFREDNDALAA